MIDENQKRGNKQCIDFNSIRIESVSAAEETKLTTPNQPDHLKINSVCTRS